ISISCIIRVFHLNKATAAPNFVCLCGFANCIPTLLVYVDGGPAWRKVEGTKVERVLNTRPLILKDVDGKIYLHLYDGWMASASLQGPWSVAATTPSSFAAAMKKLKEQNAPVDLLEGSPPEQQGGGTSPAPSTAGPAGASQSGTAGTKT